MFYAEINENGKCFHITPNELPLSDTIIAVKDSSVLGKIWDGEKFVEDPDVTAPVELIDPTQEQLSRIEEQQLVIMEALADQYEEQQEANLINMEVQATIYEELMAMQESEGN